MNIIRATHTRQSNPFKVEKIPEPIFKKHHKCVMVPVDSFTGASGKTITSWECSCGRYETRSE